MNALDIARAALTDVGRDPSAITPPFGPGGTIASDWTRADETVARAAHLGLLAAFGPGYEAKCLDCFMANRAACHPVSELLRGVRCGR